MKIVMGPNGEYGFSFSLEIMPLANGKMSIVSRDWKDLHILSDAPEALRLLGPSIAKLAEVKIHDMIGLTERVRAWDIDEGWRFTGP